MQNSRWKNYVNEIFIFLCVAGVNQALISCEAEEKIRENIDFISIKLLGLK